MMADSRTVVDDPTGKHITAQDGTPLPPTPLPTAEVGASGLIQFGGRISEEFLKQLDGERGRRVFREMSDNDPVIGAVLFAVDMTMRQVEWRIDPADESPEALDVAEFIESCMSDMSFSWADTLSSILSFLPYGWSFCETIYKVRGGLDTDDPKRRSEHSDGKIGWRKIALRSQDSLFKWEFDEDGGIIGMWQSAPPDWVPVYIPIEKALLFRTSTYKNNPEGRSILRNAYRPWFMKKRIEEIEAIGVERDLAGLPVAWVPPSMLADGASPQEVAALTAIKDIVATIKRDEQEGIVFPLAFDERGNKRFDLTLLSTGGRRQFDTDAVVARYDQRIAMTALADFILLGHENVGSFALGSSKVDMFGTALGAWLDEIAAVFNRYAVPRLLKLNNIDQELAPTMSHADVARVDLAEVGTYLGSLVSAGVPLFPDGALEEHLRSIANFPEKEATDEVDVAAPPELPPPDEMLDPETMGLAPERVTYEVPGQHPVVAPVQPVNAPPKGVTPPQLRPYVAQKESRPFVDKRPWWRRLRKHGDHDQSAHGNWAHGSGFSEGYHADDPHEAGESIASMNPAERETLQEHLVDYKSDRALDPASGGVYIADLIPGARNVGYLDVPNMDAVHEFMGVEPSLETDPVDYATQRTKAFERLPVREVPADRIIFTQETVNEVKAVERAPIPVGEWFTWPVMVQSGDDYYLLNGHHRVVPNIVQAGAELIPAHVLRT